MEFKKTTMFLIIFLLLFNISFSSYLISKDSLEKILSKNSLKLNSLQNLNYKCYFDRICVFDKPIRGFENYFVKNQKIFRVYRAESLSILDAYRVWNTSFENLNLTGSNIKIAVLDTGIDIYHKDLNYSLNTWKCFYSINGDSHENNWSRCNDDNGHGTLIAGIIAGRYDGNISKCFEGFPCGITPNATLLIAKVLDENGEGTIIDVLNGLGWAVKNGADIISMSFGSQLSKLGLDTCYPEYDDNNESKRIWREFIDTIDFIAKEYNIVLVAAAGNDQSTFSIPACAKNVIAVGAIDKNKNIASFSSRGPVDGRIKPDIVAPGVLINSTYPTNTYNISSGTSMSTPFVSGAIALLLEALQKDNINYYSQDIKALVLTSPNELERNNTFGSGILNVTELIRIRKNFLTVNLSNDEILILNISKKDDNPFKITIYRHENSTQSNNISIVIITDGNIIYQNYSFDNVIQYKTLGLNGNIYVFITTSNSTSISLASSHEIQTIKINTNIIEFVSPLEIQKVMNGDLLNIRFRILSNDLNINLSNAYLFLENDRNVNITLNFSFENSVFYNISKINLTYPGNYYLYLELTINFDNLFLIRNFEFPILFFSPEFNYSISYSNEMFADKEYSVNLSIFHINSSKIENIEKTICLVNTSEVIFCNTTTSDNIIVFTNISVNGTYNLSVKVLDNNGNYLFRNFSVVIEFLPDKIFISPSKNVFTIFEPLNVSVIVINSTKNSVCSFCKVYVNISRGEEKILTKTLAENILNKPISRNWQSGTYNLTFFVILDTLFIENFTIIQLQRINISTNISNKIFSINTLIPVNISLNEIANVKINITKINKTGIYQIDSKELIGLLGCTNQSLDVNNKIIWCDQTKNFIIRLNSSSISLFLIEIYAYGNEINGYLLDKFYVNYFDLNFSVRVNRSYTKVKEIIPVTINISRINISLDNILIEIPKNISAIFSLTPNVNIVNYYYNNSIGVLNANISILEPFSTNITLVLRDEIGISKNIILSNITAYDLEIKINIPSNVIPVGSYFLIFVNSNLLPLKIPINSNFSISLSNECELISKGPQINTSSTFYNISAVSIGECSITISAIANYLDMILTSSKTITITIIRLAKDEISIPKVTLPQISLLLRKISEEIIIREGFSNFTIIFVTSIGRDQNVFVYVLDYPSNLVQIIPKNQTIKTNEESPFLINISLDPNENRSEFEITLVFNSSFTSNQTKIKIIVLRTKISEAEKQNLRDEIIKLEEEIGKLEELVVKYQKKDLLDKLLEARNLLNLAKNELQNNNFNKTNEYLIQVNKIINFVKNNLESEIKKKNESKHVDVRLIFIIVSLIIFSVIVTLFFLYPKIKFKKPYYDVKKQKFVWSEEDENIWQKLKEKWKRKT